MRRSLRLAAILVGLLLALPSLAAAAEPPDQDDPCSTAGRNACGTTGVGRYDTYRYGLRWFGDYRGAVPGVDAATWCIDLRFWYPGRRFGYEERAAKQLKNRDGDAVSAAALRRISYATWQFGRTRDRTKQAAVMLYVHDQMGDGAPGEVDPGAVGRGVATRFATVARDAKRLAGPYTVTATAGDDLVAGKPARLRVKVTAASGAAVPAAKVALKATGADLPASVTTRRDGTASVVFTPTSAANDLRVDATAAGLAAPAPTLYVPTRGKAARNGQRLVAAKSQAYTASLAADVSAVVPTVTTAATPPTIAVGQSTSDTVTIAGPPADWTAKVQVQLFGPYRTPAEISCAGEPAASTSYDAKAGVTTTPAVPLGKPGLYAYRLVIPSADGVTGVTTACPDPAEVVTVVSQPTVATQISAQSTTPGSTVTDTVAVSGLNGEAATVLANLYGPFAAADRIGCDGAPVWSGSLAVPGDGSYVTEPVTLPTPGYYTYREGLQASAFVQPFDTACAEAAETTVVRGAPSITTQVSDQTVAPGAQLTDTAVVTGLGKLAAPVRVELWGPFPSPDAITCTGTPYATQTFTAEGDGSYVTAPLTVDRAGYYSYREAIDGTPAYDGTQTACGEAAETSFAEAEPKVETVVSRAVTTPGSSLTDRIRVSGLGKTPVTIGVELYGPYATKADMDCSGRPYARGSVDAAGDGVVRSAPIRVRRAGFYTFRETIEASPGVKAHTTACAEVAETSLSRPLILTGAGDPAVEDVFAAARGDKRPEPTRVQLTRLGVDAPVSPIGIDTDAGALGISANIGKVGWWRDGAAPGDANGAILLAGHVDSAKRGAGAFYPLKSARRGDTITVSLRGGQTRRYRVSSVKRRLKDKLPTDVFSTAGARRLVLVTCGGPFDARIGHYRDNVIVTARPVS